MFKRLLSIGTTLLLAAGLTVGGVVAPASATHPVVTGTAVCNQVTGKFDVTWRVTGDIGYPNAIATIKEQSVTTTPTLLNKTVQGAGYVTATQSGLASGTHSLTVKVQWSTHAVGSLVSKAGNVSTSGPCSIPTPQDSSAAISITPASCSVPQSLVLGATAFASWGTPSIVQGPGAYSVTATANANHTFPGGATTKQFTGNLADKLSATDPSWCIEACYVITAGGVSTNLDANGWTFGETRSTGHNDYVDGGLRVWTEGATSTDKAAGYHAIDIALGDVGTPSITLSDTSGVKPGLQLGIDRDGDGDRDGYLVQEGNIYGAGNWWTNASGFGVPSAFGYASVGTLQQFLDANPDARVVSFGYSLGSGVLGSAVITQITVGCSTYTFDAEVLEPEVSIQVGACYPSDATSSKNVSFVFDNTRSTVPVTFSVPGVTPAILVTVVAGATVTVASEPVTKAGASYEVFVNGSLSPLTLTVAPFLGCAQQGIPGDPIIEPQACVAGELVSGSIWVDLQPGLIYTIIGQSTRISPVLTATTLVAPGTYVVTVEAAPGYLLTGDSEWPYTIDILKPDHCELIDTQAVPKVAITCSAAGSYTLPAVVGVVWSVNGTVMPAASYRVFFGTTVNITAAPADGYGFVSGAQASWIHEFTTPTDCELITHPLVVPAAPSMKELTCAANGSYTVPESEGVLWSVDDLAVGPGTATVSSTQTVTIVAAPDAPDYGFEAGAQTLWQFVFTKPATGTCGELETLALTGTDSVPLFFGGAAGLLLLGGAGLILARRRAA